MYYLIEHNRTSKKTNWKEYSDYESVKIASMKKEQNYLSSHQHAMEVVVFEANSIDDLRRTHSRYFVTEEKKDNTANTLLAVGLVGLAIYMLNRK